MKQDILIVSSDALEPKRKAEHELYEYVRYEVTPRKDFSRCYAAVYEVPPGKANYPYHYHQDVTEVFYFLGGEGVLETPEGERSVRTGDFVVCPPGERGAHRLKNSSETDVLRYIDFDTVVPVDVVHYPHSGKTGVIVQNESSTFFRDKDETGYYDGE